jgi:glyoxylase-like metal-dependent hydrolase (beta-lactamase superfamily II)
MTELHPAVADLDPRLVPLSKQDFDLAGIDIVVNTHLHYDHCGGNRLFPGVPIHVQARELVDARSLDNYTIREWVDFDGATYVGHEGEVELLPGIRLLPTPGHTDGHQSVLVETGGRPVVVGGDRGGLVRRARRAAHRRPAAGARARARARLARARARALAATHHVRRAAGHMARGDLQVGRPLEHNDRDGGSLAEADGQRNRASVALGTPGECALWCASVRECPPN